MSDTGETKEQWKKRIIAVMNRAGWRGTWEDAVKQLADEDKAWKAHGRKVQ